MSYSWDHHIPVKEDPQTLPISSVQLFFKPAFNDAPSIVLRTALFLRSIYSHDLVF
jgi:hypothetical protein